MPRRDGAPTEQEIAAQRAGQGPPPIENGVGMGSVAAAAAALAATSAAAGGAATPLLAGPAAIATAGAVAAGILGAFDRFQADRRSEQDAYVIGLLEHDVPDLDDADRRALVDLEMEYEKAFAAKSRARLAADLPAALAIADPDERRAAVLKVLDREKRFAEMREAAIAVRALGAAEKRIVKADSPTGAFWRLSPNVQEHTADCLAMGGQAWPWSVLDTHHPPLHVGCACELVDIQRALDEGMMTPGDLRTADQGWADRSVAEAALDDEAGIGWLDDVDMDLLEAEYDRRWAKGTTKAGQFRPKRGGDPGAVLRRRRRIRQSMHSLPAPSPAMSKVTQLAREPDVVQMKVADLREGDHLRINGTLERVVKVNPKTPGLVTLEHSGLVHIDREHMMGVPSQPAPKAATSVDFDPREFKTGLDDVRANVRIALRDRVAKLKAGASLTLPGGVRIVAGDRNTMATGGRSRPTVYRVHGPDGHVDVLGNDLAAAQALHVNAATTAPDSLGGARSLGDYREAFLTDAQRSVLAGGMWDGETHVGWDAESRPVIGRQQRARIDLPRAVNPDGSIEALSYGTPIDPVRTPPPAPKPPEPDVAPPPPAPTGGPSHADVAKLATMRRPKEGGPLLEGFAYDPTIARSEARGEVLHVPVGFFKQSRAVREKVVFRHLGGRLADGLGTDGVDALAAQDGHLASRKAVVDAYFALNSDVNRPQFVALHPDAARLVAGAALERGMPLHPDAGKLAVATASDARPVAEHPGHALVAALKGRRDGDVHAALGEAGYQSVGTVGAGSDMRMIYRNHEAGASLSILYSGGGDGGLLETGDITLDGELGQAEQVAMARSVGDGGLDEHMNTLGFGPSTRVGDYLEFVHPDGDGVAWHVDGPQAGKARTFEPTLHEVTAARQAVFARDPSSQIVAGDDFKKVRDALDAPWGNWRMEATGTRGDPNVDLPDRTLGFATFGRGPQAITVHYADHDGVRRVVRAGLADPDPAHPGRIVNPVEHATTIKRIAEEKAAAEKAARAKSEIAGAQLSAAVTAGDADGIKAALAGRGVGDAVGMLQRQAGMELRGRRRSRAADRSSLITYTLRGPGGETLKITGPLRFGDSAITKVDIQANPQGGKRTRLPAGTAPKNLDELLVDTLGRADELGARFGAGVHVSAVVQGGVSKGAAAHHEWNGTIAIGKSTQGRRIKAYLAKRKKGERLSEGDHLTFYDDLETLQHEINHGVAKPGEKAGGLSFGPDDYRGLGKNVEEALTEETAHLLTADWLRSYGFTDVLAAVKRNPDHPSVKGVYREYRVQLRALLDDAGVPEGERPALLMRMKFEMTPAERNAELVRIAKADGLQGALYGPSNRDQAARRREMNRDFQPILRADLADIDAEPVAVTRGGRRLGIGAAVMADTVDGPRAAGVVVGIRAGMVQVRYEDGITLWISDDRVE